MSIDIVGWTNVGSAIDGIMDCEEHTAAAEDLIEFAGRACYQSFNKPNEATRSNKDYMANILAQGHESVLEHASVSFYVTGFSRNMLLELERHRHLSFSVISTRFVDAAKMKVVVPPALRAEGESYLDDLDPNTVQTYTQTVQRLLDLGSTRKEAREAARYLLPGNLETKFVITGNMRAWRDVLKKRYSVHADAEIRLFAGEIFAKLREHAPNVFQDFPWEPFD
jgi:thymidylate synthase (FAD)